MSNYARERLQAQPKERPILFSGPMVRAILEGRKSQTRRIVKPQPKPFISHDKPGRWWWFDQHRAGWPTGRIHEPTLEDHIRQFCPYGGAGDRLWVRETLRLDGDTVWMYAADKGAVGCNRADESQMIAWVFHKETSHCPSIHMPRWASRLTLEVTGVRVERLQDISEADALAEGVSPIRLAYWTGRMVGPNGRGGVVQKGADWDNPGDPPADLEHAWLDRYEESARDTFRSLWGSINAKRGYGWETNPWVWVVEFKVVQP